MKTPITKIHDAGKDDEIFILVCAAVLAASVYKIDPHAEELKGKLEKLGEETLSNSSEVCQKLEEFFENSIDDGTSGTKEAAGD